MIEHGTTFDRLHHIRLIPVETKSTFSTQIGSAFELRRRVSEVVAAAE